MSFRPSLLKFSFALALQCWSSLAFAQDKKIQLPYRNEINKAIRVQITPKGQKYFETQLTPILENLGVRIDEGYFSETKLDFDKPLNLDELEKTHPEEIKMFKQVREILAQWLIGFTLNSHQPAIRIGPSEYQATFKKFGLYMEPELMRSLGKKDGAVMAIKLEISKIQAVAEPFKIWDLGNPDLGVVGYKRIEASIGSPENPVVVRLPFYIRIGANSVLEFEALNVEENFANTPVEVKMLDLIAPEISVNVNGKIYRMNQKKLDQTFSENLPAVLKMLRQYLSDFARVDLPKTLNTKAKEYLSGSIEQIQNMEPAGKDPKDTRPDFKWGLKLNSLNLDSSLDIHFNAFIEDYYRNPKQPNVVPAPPVPTSGSRGAPALNNLATNQYDLALSVDRGLINRVLQLSYLRGNFSTISQSDGSTLKLRAAPVVDYAPVTAKWPVGTDEAYLKLRVTIETEPDSSWLDDVIIISFDIIAKLKQASDKSGLEIVLVNIDTSTLYMDDQYFSWIGGFIKGKVLDGIRDNLKEKSKDWKLGKEKIPGKLDLPPTLLGIKLDLTKMIMDPNGHLVLYTNYANGNSAGVRK